MRRRLASLLVPAALAVAAIPFAFLLLGALRGDLGAEPVETIQLATGLAALRLLLASLAVTPLRRLTGWNDLIRLRRPLGLAAFAYVVLHASSYFVFDQELSPALIAADVVEHPWVTAGFGAFLLLIPLAITSTKGWIRRLGGARWNRLHRLVYPAALLAGLHFLWLVKKDLSRPLAYGAVLLVLLGARLAWARRRADVLSANPGAH